MNLCNQGHDDIAYDDGKECPLCAALFEAGADKELLEKLKAFVEKQYGKVEFNLQENRWSWVEEKPNVE